MVTLESFRAGKLAWLHGALQRPSMYLSPPAAAAESLLWHVLDDLAELDDTRAQLDEGASQLRRWLGVGGAPSLPVGVAWEEITGQPPCTDTVVALFVGLLAELNLLDAPVQDRPPPPEGPGELERWASAQEPSWTTLGKIETRTRGVRLGAELSAWVMVHPGGLQGERPWVLRPAPTLRQGLVRV